MWFEIIRWSTLVLMWIAMAGNIFACVINIRSWRKYRALNKELFKNVMEYRYLIEPCEALNEED